MILAEVVETGDIIAAAATIIAAMAVAITTMWKVLHANMKDTETKITEKLDKCEREHRSKDQWAKDVSHALGELQGTVKGREEVVTQVETSIDKVISKVTDVHKDVKKLLPGGGES